MTTTRDQEEQDLRIVQMTVNIEQMQRNIAKMDADNRWEAKKYALQAALVIAAAMSAASALTVLFLRLAGRG